MNANLTVPYGKRLNIAESTSAAVNGNLTVDYYSSAYIDGALTVTGNVDLGSNGNESYFGVLYMSNENSKLYVGGNFIAVNKTYNCKITNGEVIFCGDKLQKVNKITAPTIILENKSQDGVVFGSAISPTVLFNHNGLNFTLYNNGSGSVFKDYDGDLVKDNVDDNPTVFSNHNYYNVVCDINGSGKTDLLDFIRFKKLLANNQSGSNIDFNNDGLVNAQDITIMKEFLIDCFK